MSDITKTPREELECKKKYLYDYSMFWECNDGSKCQILEEDVCDLLNEQQELIEELHSSDHMGWGRAEKFEKELKQKKIYIKRLEYKVQKFKEMNGEQQSTIRKLQDFVGQSDYENAKLRQKINKLKEENVKLREERQRLIYHLNKEPKR